MREVRADMRGWSAKRKALRACEMLWRGDRFIEEFGERQYDNCFENGDGDDVVCHIVAECEQDPTLAYRVSISQFANLVKWREFAARRQTSAIPVP